MSSHEFGLLSAPASHDHFQSAFMQGYNHHHYDHDRYSTHSTHSTSNSVMSSGAPFDRYLHSMHDAAPRDTYLHDRRVSDPSPLSRYTFPRQQQQHGPLTSPPYPSTFEYTHNPLSHSTVLHRETALPEHHNNALRNLSGFDPRPPHAGWTPKEEVDDEIRTRELLGGIGRSGKSPLGSQLGTSSASPRGSQSPKGRAGRKVASAGTSATSKTYSFVSLPGNAVRKRPRRRYDEIERLYACSWPDCSKAYGTLNHLNAHVSMQRHGPKRSPSEFKELRKQWRQQKKEPSVPAAGSGNIHGNQASTGPSTRRRRVTEPALSASLDPMTSHSQSTHKLSLDDLRFPLRTTDEEVTLGPSPTSSASDSVAYWPESTLSPPEHQHQHRPSLHYPVSMQGNAQSPPISPAHLSQGGLSPPLPRLSQDGPMLTPLSAYHPPSPPLTRLGPASTLLQPLHPSTLVTLSPPRSPENQRNVYEEYQDRRGSI